MSIPVKQSSRVPSQQGSSLQIVFASILAISLLLAINFTGRIAANRQIEGKRDDLLKSISTLQAQATGLQSELNYVNSNAFVSQWARKEGRMVKGEEVLVVPVPGMVAPGPTPTPFITAADNQVVTDETSNLELWWRLFFDSPAPSNLKSP
jgi:hypothetical protein